MVHSNQKKLPVYEEYHTFLKDMGHTGSFKNYKYYLKQYSFFKNLINLVPGAIYLTNFETQQYLFVSEGSISVLGYTNKEMIKKGREYILGQVHPDDIKTHASRYFNKFIEHTRRLSPDELKKCRFSVNYRFKRKDGVYVKVLQQYVILEVNDEGYPLLSLGLVTDITAHKPDNKMTFSISRYDAKKGFEITSTDTYPNIFLSVSKREHEIVKYLTQGLSSKMIAEKLKISINTVNNHRQSIFKKTGAKNVAQLIAYSVTNNLI